MISFKRRTPDYKLKVLQTKLSLTWSCPFCALQTQSVTSVASLFCEWLPSPFLLCFLSQFVEGQYDECSLVLFPLVVTMSSLTD